MKKVSIKIISIVLSLLMIVSMGSVSFAAAAEKQSEFSMPAIQTLLTDGKALKTYLEGEFLSLDKADEMLAQSLPDLAQTACANMDFLFYQMGYNEQQYPSDLDSLLLALARVIGSLDAEVFKEPEHIQTTDMSLIYHLAYMGGTDYIERINASLPEALRFDTTKPVISLSKSQMSEIEQYYARWKAGALRLDDFDVRNYLGDVTPLQYFKAVLLVFIADDARLPAITQRAIDFTFTPQRKAALAEAIATLADNLTEKPVSAALQVLSSSDFAALVKPLVRVADAVTVKTDAYSYKLYQEGIYTDTDGSAVDHIAALEDGSYAYIGGSYVSDYEQTIDALLDFTDGIYEELSTSVLECVLSKRLDKLRTLVSAAFVSAVNTVNAQQNRLLSDIKSAEIEKRFARAQIASVESGAELQAMKNEILSQLEEVRARVCSLQEQLEALEMEEAIAKDKVKGYYDTLAELEALITEENEEDITSSPEYIAAKERVEATEASLAENYAAQEQLLADIATLSRQADELATRLYQLSHTYSASERKAVYNKMITAADAVIRESNAALAELPDKILTDKVGVILGELIDTLLAAFDGVYPLMMNESPVKALAQFVLGLGAFASAVEGIDWNEIAAVTDPIFAQIDAMIDGAAGAFIGNNGGNNLLSMLSEMIDGFMEQYGVYDFINADYLNRFVKEQVLGDGSEVMVNAAAGLQEMFGNVEPNYESIVSCLIPLLSAFNIDNLIQNIDDIGTVLQCASPRAFAYLAGLDSAYLQGDYLQSVNANLRAAGYQGSGVAPLISLGASSASSLLSYVQMEQSGSTLAQIAAAGFNWKNYAGSVDSLEIANALVKIALGDPDKLGAVCVPQAGDDGALGKALVSLLCDLFNDIYDNPVETLIAKLSDAQGIAAIVDWVLNLLNNANPDYMSYQMYFVDSIYYNGKGQTTFYDTLITNSETGLQEMIYTGPKMLGIYVPIAAAAIDLFASLDTMIAANGGDLLKTLLCDKTVQLTNLVRAFISYEDAGGNPQPGALFYLILGYEDYFKSRNTVMSYEVLISLAQAAIDAAQGEYEAQTKKVTILQAYLEQAQQFADAQKLAMAKHLGVLDDSVTAYSDEALTAAIEAKIQSLGAQIAALGAQIDADTAALASLRDAATAAQSTLTKFEKFFKDITKDDLYDAICEIFDEADITLLGALRIDYEDYVDDNLGDGKFDELAALISDNYDDYEDDGDSFIDDFIKKKTGGEGLGLTAFRNTLIAQNTAAAQAVSDAEAALESKQTECAALADALQALESGAILSQITAAGESATIHVFDGTLKIEGDFTVADLQERIDNMLGLAAEQYAQTLAAQNAAIAEYMQLQEPAKQAAAQYSPALVELITAAAEPLAEGIADIITGEAADGSDNIYYYIINRQIVQILTTGGRLEGLMKILVGLYAPALRALVDEGLFDEVTANQLIAAVPPFDAFYHGALKRFVADFGDNPIGAAGVLTAAFAETVLSGFEAVEDELTHDTMQIKKINRDLINLFDPAFPNDWQASYSQCLVGRIGELYQLIADILGLSFIKDLLGERIGTKGSLSGKLDTGMLYTDATVKLYMGKSLIASVTVAPDGDGTFSFDSLDEGSYRLVLECDNALPVEIKSIDVIADDTADLTDHSKGEIDLIKLPVGDIHRDNKIDIQDVNELLLDDNYGGENAQCDINRDGIVDIGDLSVILASGNFAKQAVSVTY